MVAAIICSLCRPSLLEGDPPHHYGQRYEHKVGGLFSGFECACVCVQQGPLDYDPLDYGESEGA